jgi:hypothetical protein
MLNDDEAPPSGKKSFSISSLLRFSAYLSPFSSCSPIGTPPSGEKIFMRMSDLDFLFVFLLTCFA